jgi:hypothetical protein
MEVYAKGSSISVATESDSHYVAKMAKQVGATAILDKATLIDLIWKQYYFTTERRVIVWRYLFRLPLNEKAYSLLASQPLHPAVRTLPNTLPIRYSILCNRLVRLLSTLTYWHPPLAECDWLPGLVFPFLRIFERDSITSFEFLLTILVNWCKEWLALIPNPPLGVLARIDEIAKSAGGEAPISVAWPALRSFFCEVATTEAALIICDNILSAQPVFLEYLVASYALIRGRKIVNEHNVRTVIDRARSLFEKHHQFNTNTSPFVQLSRGFYPIVPSVERIPQWREKEIERIKAEAQDAEEEEDIDQQQIENEKAQIERRRRIWLAERSILREIEEEQMLEFRRREQEILVREGQREAVMAQIRRKEVHKRMREEGQAMDEWRRDCDRVENEMKEVAEGRRRVWARWLSEKENAAKLAKEEMEVELELMRKKNEMYRATDDSYRKLGAELAAEEERVIADCLAKSREIEEEKLKWRNDVKKKRAAMLRRTRI